MSAPSDSTRPPPPSPLGDEQLLFSHGSAEGRSYWGPTLLVFVVAAITAIATLYVERNAGGFSPMAYNEDARAGGGTAEPAHKPLDPLALGKRLYQTTCVTCHQATGLGLPGVYPPLAASEFVLGGEERLIRIVLHGLSGPVMVSGQQYPGNVAMPAFGKVPGSGYNWRDDQIAAVLTYIRQEWGNKVPAISPDKVAEIRGKVVRDKPWTASELEVLP